MDQDNQVSILLGILWFQKMSIPSPQRELEIQRGGVGSRPWIFQESMGQRMFKEIVVCFLCVYLQMLGWIENKQQWIAMQKANCVEYLL